jgi:predicted ester cyclase
VVADGFVSHSFPSPTGNGKADLKAATERMGKLLTNIRFREEMMIAEGDIVAVRLTARATPVAEFMGIAPSGRSYEITEMHFFRVSHGRITEHWHEFDSTKLMSQLRGD